MSKCGMTDLQIMEKLIQDRIRLESMVNGMAETLKMADNVIYNCVQTKQEANYSSTDVREEIARNLAWAESR